MNASPAVDTSTTGAESREASRGRDGVIQTQIQISAVVVRGENYLSKKHAGARSS